DRPGWKRESARPPMMPAQHRGDRPIGGIQVGAYEASRFAAGSSKARRTAQQHHVGYRRQRFAGHLGPEFDLAIVVYQGDRGQRPDQGLRTEFGVGAENDPADAKSTGLKLETSQASYAVSVLANVSPKQKFHG